MSIYLKLLLFIVDLVIPLCIGILINKKTGLHKESLDKLLYINILFLFPFLGVLSFWILKLDQQLIWLPLLGIVMQIIPGIIAFLRVNSKFDNPLEKGSYILGVMLSNRGVVGSLSVFIMFGEIGYAYARTVILLANIVLYMFCYPMAQHFYRKHKNHGDKIKLKKILFNKNQIPVLGIIIGFLLNISGIERPDIFNNIFNFGIHISAWIALIPIGMAIDMNEIKSYKKLTPELCIIKFILVPISIYFLSNLIIDNRIMLYTLFVLSFSPTAINAVIACKINKINIHIAMSSFIYTTIIYLIIVFPLILFSFMLLNII